MLDMLDKLRTIIFNMSKSFFEFFYRFGKFSVSKITTEESFFT